MLGSLVRIRPLPPTKITKMKKHKIERIADLIPRLHARLLGEVSRYITNNLPRVLEEYYGLKEGQKVVDKDGRDWIIRLDPCYLIEQLQKASLGIHADELLSFFEREMVRYLFANMNSMGDWLSIHTLKGNEGKKIGDVLKKEVDFEKDYTPATIIVIGGKLPVNSYENLSSCPPEYTLKPF